MARTSRIIIKNQPAIYHVISRSTLLGFPFTDADKEVFLNLIKKYSKIYFTEILGFCIMSNHFHILVRMHPSDIFSSEEIKSRYFQLYGASRKLSDNQIPIYRDKFGNLSDFMRDIKVNFSRYYNKKNDRKGYLWGDRFKSVIVEKGHTLINCLAYIDLNPIRAGIVKRPEEYRYSSIGYHIQTGNKDGFLSLEFGSEHNKHIDDKEKFRNYRRYLYQKGGQKKENSGSISNDIVQKEKNRNYDLTIKEVFLYRSKYYTDGGIIGTEAFVSEIYNKIKHMLFLKRNKKPKKIPGYDQIFSLRGYRPLENL